jgi:acyl carrier protein
MNHTAERLSRCFRAVFPELSDAQIEQADITNVARWDSVNQIMLMTVVGEEFGVELDIEDLERLGSYKGFLEYVSKASPQES